MEWTDWNWINVFFVLFSAAVAAKCFNEENNTAGWFNVFASAVNGALVLVKLGF